MATASERAVNMFNVEHEILVLGRTRGCTYLIYFQKCCNIAFRSCKNDKYECEDE